MVFCWVFGVVPICVDLGKLGLLFVMLLRIWIFVMLICGLFTIFLLFG